VTVTAVDGNLFIRRGPHLAFNSIGVLSEGETLVVTGRDVLAHWVRVALPSPQGASGWISIQTRFSVLHGEATDLEAVETVDWPAGASARNCTHHPLVVQPGETVLMPVDQFPDNEVALYPGEYTAYDLDVEGEPEVLSFSLREGATVEVIDDGSGERTECE
jgi:hypothetical protein